MLKLRRRINMPASGTSLKNGPRHNLIDKTMWKDYIKASGNDISYLDFKKIIVQSNLTMRSRILDNTSGYKLSESLGYIAVKRYKPRLGVKSIDFHKSKEAGCTVYHTNFHSYGYKGRIIWYTAKVSKCRHINLYKFIPDRDFQRELCAKIKGGRVYSEFGYDFFKAKRIKLNFNRL